MTRRVTRKKFITGAIAINQVYKKIDMNNIAIITARSGSKGLKDKNILPLAGMPLIAYSIIAARESGMFKDIMVSTDSDYYASIAKEYGASVPFLRSKELSGCKGKQAEDCYKDSILMYIKLFEKSSRAYIDRIINTVNNIVSLFDPIESNKWMEEFVDEDKVEDWLSKEIKSE